MKTTNGTVLSIGARFNYKPTKAEVRLLEVLCDPISRHWSVAEICRRANISRETYYRAFSKNAFFEYYHLLTYELIKKQAIPLVLTGLVAAKSGSFPHWKALMDMIDFNNQTIKKREESLTIRFI